MKHLYEMATGESIGHMTDDVTGLQKVKVLTQLYLRTNILKKAIYFIYVIYPLIEHGRRT